MNDFLISERDVVLIRIVKTKGSSPRDPGAFLLVSRTSSFGTIGGGCLEFDATKTARSFVTDPKFTISFRNYNLGPSLGQCCGGRVELSFEKLTDRIKKKIIEKEKDSKKLWDNVLIFGAGHVGQALIQQLKFIPLNVSIVDSRPAKTLDFLLPDGCKNTAFPEEEIRNAKSGTAYVILTHDHALDFLLVKEALLRKDAAYIGMIGSKTKKAVLQRWLEKENVGSFQKVSTPLGASISSIKGLDKRPEIIAPFVITEILTAFQTHRNSIFNNENKARLNP